MVYILMFQELVLSDYVGKTRSGLKVLNWYSFPKIRPKKFWDIALGKSPVEFKFGDIDFVAPDGLIWLYHILLYRKSREAPPSLIDLPQNPRINSFLKNAKFGEISGLLNYSFRNPQQYDFAEEYQGKQDVTSDVFSKISYMDKRNRSRIATILLDAISESLLEVYNIRKFGEERFAVMNSFVGTLSEIMSNMMEHGKFNGDSEGFISIILPKKNFPVIRYCFSDIGNGFLHTISNKPDLTKFDREITKHEDAIIAGLLYRLLYPENQVFGLHQTLEFIRQRNGSINIISGDANVRIDLGTRKNQKLLINNFHNPSLNWIEKMAIIKKGNNFPGTSILVELRIN